MNNFSVSSNNPLYPPHLNPAPREGQKNYVFVDEHNRHKRLKVMRACAGCRKRKIKCDAATTNTWPCSACTRLKLQCVPPTFGHDPDSAAAAAAAAAASASASGSASSVSASAAAVAAHAAAAINLSPNYSSNHNANISPVDVAAAPAASAADPYSAAALTLGTFNGLSNVNLNFNSINSVNSDHNAAVNAAAAAAAAAAVAADQRASAMAAYNAPLAPLSRGMYYQTQPDFASVNINRASTNPDRSIYAPLSSQSMDNLRQFSQSAANMNINASSTAQPAGSAVNPMLPPHVNMGMGISDASTTPKSIGAGSNPSVGDISDAFGDLKIDESGIAPYIRQQRKNESSRAVSAVSDDVPNAPHLYDCDPSYSLPDFSLPPDILSSTTAPDGSIFIPPELMPSEDHAMRLFDIFFNHIHPYAPVVHRGAWYAAWHGDRSRISPLLLEAVFACASRFDVDANQSSGDNGADGDDQKSSNANETMKWLALANKHENAFLEEPRLSTVQAMVLLLKAREAIPKRGYYYRSWQSLKTMVSMAKDLDLHEHYDYHATNKPCGLCPKECLEQTRIWQSLLVLEAMIGGSQGRSDYGVPLDTVELRPHWTPPNTDAWEAERSRQFTYYIQLSHIIRISLERYHQISKQPDWGADPLYASISSHFDKWILNLPPDLQVLSTPDANGNIPPLPSHFIANMHAHLHLGVILLCRPLLLASKNFSAGGQWRTHMSRCYTAAKTLCRLQEAIIITYGLNGLLYMQRGVNFAIYGVLACTMIHLVATTSPDPEFNADSRMYFTRHMRILEQCSAAWPLPTLRNQINSLRLAFSQDVTKPFKLKENFPYGSPSEPYLPSPRFDQGLLGSQSGTSAGVSQQQQQQQQQNQQTKSAEQGRLVLESQPMTPPDTTTSMAVTGGDAKVSSMALADYLSNTNPQAAMIGVSPGDTTTTSWDPTRIMDQWDIAFPTGGSSVASSDSPSSNRHASTPEYGDILTPSYMAQYVQQPKMINLRAVNDSNSMSAAAVAVTTVASTAAGVPQHVSHADPRQQQQQQQQQQHQHQHGLMHHHHYQAHGGGAHGNAQPHTAYTLHPVHISARDWQRSVASAFDPHGVKRGWS